MEPETMKLIAIAVIMSFGTLMTAYSIGKIGSSAAEAIGRNPEAAPKIQTSMILAVAFVEAIAIYALVVSLVLKFA